MEIIVKSTGRSSSSSTTDSTTNNTTVSAALQSSEDGYVLTEVSIVDVENGITIPGQTVFVQGEWIKKICTQGQIEIPEEARVINGNRLYLIPSLVDAHVHYYDAPVFGRLMITNGILLVRDTGMPNEYILKLRDDLNQGVVLGPEMITTGLILDGVPPIIPTISIGVGTPEDGRMVVRQQVKAGVNMIKTYSRLDRDVFMAIMDEAHKYDLKVVAHLPESVYLEEAVAAGLDSSEHFNGFEKVIANLLGESVNLTFRGQASDAGYFLRLNEVNPEKLQAVYERIRASGMIICPTVVTFKTLTKIKQILAGSFSLGEYISSSLMDMWKLFWSQQGDLPDFIWQNWSKMLVDMNAAGIPLMIGTDLMLPGLIPGYSAHEEMVIWQEAGIPPADVLRGATNIPAKFFGFNDRLGTICEGKSASMVLVRGNPLEDIRNAQKIESVFLRGKYYNRKDLDRLLSEAKALAHAPS
jgi:imidazolonepropionase-like amidohydrolase